MRIWPLVAGVFGRFRRMSGRFTLMCGLGGALLLAAACQPEFEQPDPVDLNAARQAALDFDRRMQLQIIDRLDRGEDPVALYLAYTDHVPGWAKEISDKAKFDFSRTSLDVRNPTAAADAWETAKMQEFAYMADTGLDPATFESSEIVQEGDARVFRWIRPMQMTEHCLACHGEQVDGRIKLLLAQEYPDDAAIGYFEGQVGGAYSVRRVLSVKGKPPPAYVPVELPPRLPADERQPGDAPLVPLPPEALPAPEAPVEEPPADPL
jgi:hypothetical protein